MNALIIFVCIPCTSKMHYQLPFISISVIWGPHADHLGKRCTSHYALSRAVQSFNERAMLSDHEKTSPRLSLEVKDHSKNSPDYWLYGLWTPRAVCVMMLQKHVQIMKMYDGRYFFFELTRPGTEWFSLEWESITRSSSYCQQNDQHGNNTDPMNGLVLWGLYID